ncbi:MAG: hypothetical protein HC835_15925 [Oscillatoriales cyanobacterium RM2_1_1]|nr:hypothetical protein [Oscillatoriales cyanobacterium RM2_1_1]
MLNRVWPGLMLATFSLVVIVPVGLALQVQVRPQAPQLGDTISVVVTGLKTDGAPPL